jgi:hypothetical protein
MQSKNPTRSRDQEVKAIRLALWHKEDLPPCDLAGHRIVSRPAAAVPTQ